MGGIVFVGGVHGVGKTTFCNMLVDEMSIRHFSASKLITNFSKIEFPLDKHIKSIGTNQPILINAVKQYIPQNQLSFLDGHFCLIDIDGNIEKVSEETFSSLNIKAIICLKCAPEVIAKRLSERDGFSHDNNFISSLQYAEINYSKSISHKINVPYYLVETPISNENKDKLLIGLKELKWQ